MIHSKQIFASERPVAFPTDEKGQEAGLQAETRFSRFSLNYSHRIPLTARLTALLVTLLIVGLGISGITVLGILQSHLVGQIDQQLTRMVQKMSDLDDWESLIEVSHSQPVGYYVRIKTQNKVQASRWESAEYEIPGPDPQDLNRLEKVAESHFSKPLTVSAEQGRTSWRAISLPLVNAKHENVGVATLALPLESVQTTMRNTRTYVVTASLCLVLLGAFAAYLLVRVFLSPLREIENVAGKIARGELHERISTKESPNTEVGSLAKSLNTMLAKIETSFNAQRQSDERIRRFVSDASHELRTPLAAIKGYGELYRIGGVPAEQTKEVFQRIESEATRMGQLVEDLLKLARLDEGRRIQMQPVNLYQIAANAALDLTALNPDRPVQLLKHHGQDPVDIAAGDQLLIVADQNLLTQVLTNLVGNVNRYTDAEVPTEILIDLLEALPPEVTLPTAPERSESPSPSTMSQISVGELTSAPPSLKTDKYVQLRFVDHGGGLPSEELEKVFNRFYRSDTSRSRETGGTGLGLSIVAAVAQVHGGIARALETPGGGLTIELLLPYRPPLPAEKTAENEKPSPEVSK